MSLLPHTRHEAAWHRHFFYRKVVLKTTWKFRLVLLLAAVFFGAVTHRFWTARSLVCAEKIAPSDALLLENFDPDYLVFERAAGLHKAGFAKRILVPVSADPGEPKRPNMVWQGIAEVMVKVAWMPEPELIPIAEIEPISLNAAYQIRDFLLAQHIQSVIVVTPGFRSERSSVVYNTVLSPAGITVSCAPVFGMTTPENWTHTWHGIQGTVEQWVKLQYYRFYVLWRMPAYPGAQ